MPEPAPFEPILICRMAAFAALAYVGGFFIIIIPSGLGVREFFLFLCLKPELARLVPAADIDAVAAVAVLSLRVIWTLADLVVAALFYLLPVERPAP